MREDTPAELQGRERIIFGNLTDILDFHKGTLIKELQECLSTPEILPSVFLQSVSTISLTFRWLVTNTNIVSQINIKLFFQIFIRNFTFSLGYVRRRNSSYTSTTVRTSHGQHLSSTTSYLRSSMTSATNCKRKLA